MGQAKNRRPATVAVCIATIPPRAELLERALSSVAAQSLLPDEVIVETDTEGRGAGPTRNLAWAKATTDYVAILDDDDTFEPDHLEVCMRAARSERADVVYPWFNHLDWPEWRPDRPDPLATALNGRLVHPFGVAFGPEQARHMRQHAFIPATILARRTMVKRVGGYPAPYTDEWTKYNGCEDWAMLVRILDAGGRFVHVPKRTWNLQHRVGTGGAPWRGTTASS